MLSYNQRPNLIKQGGYLAEPGMRPYTYSCMDSESWILNLVLPGGMPTRCKLACHAHMLGARIDLSHDANDEKSALNAGLHPFS
jgi:hypothetical protein